jgi:hypothetical protein
MFVFRAMSHDLCVAMRAKEDSVRIAQEPMSGATMRTSGLFALNRSTRKSRSQLAPHKRTTLLIVFQAFALSSRVCVGNCVYRQFVTGVIGAR